MTTLPPKWQPTHWFKLDHNRLSSSPPDLFPTVFLIILNLSYARGKDAHALAPKYMPWLKKKRTRWWWSLVTMKGPSIRKEIDSCFVSAHGCGPLTGSSCLKRSLMGNSQSRNRGLNFACPFRLEAMYF